MVGDHSLWNPSPLPLVIASKPFVKAGLMSAFALYVFGFIVFVAGVLYAEHLLHVPQTWVLVSGLVMLGLGVMTAVSHTKRRDPPSEAPPAP